MDVGRILWYFGLFVFATGSINCLISAHGREINDRIGQYNEILKNAPVSEKVAMHLFQPVDDKVAEEQFKSDVDEELVRKAEMAADEDLLGGLNLILKKQETLEDVMRAEGVRKIP